MLPEHVSIQHVGIIGLSNSHWNLYMVAPALAAEHHWGRSADNVTPLWPLGTGSEEDVCSYRNLQKEFQVGRF